MFIAAFDMAYPNQPLRPHPATLPASDDMLRSSRSLPLTRSGANTFATRSAPSALTLNGSSMESMSSSSNTVPLRLL
jgi:hypothetical protein